MVEGGSASGVLERPWACVRPSVLSSHPSPVWVLITGQPLAACPGEEVSQGKVSKGGDRPRRRFCSQTSGMTS